MHAEIDHDTTALAVERWGAAHDPRLSTVMQALVRHLHGFAREVALTEPEWAQAITWLTRAGQISNANRSEFILASDVLGLSTLVVDINHHRDSRATPATVLGPFYIEDSPQLSYGADMAEGVPGIPLFIAGTIRSPAGAPIGGADLDVWQADSQGMYEAQVNSPAPRLRGRFTSQPDGSYCVRTVAPLGYSIPMDGPVGELISRTEISPNRPAHIHFRITAKGHGPLTTHLFEKGAPYLDADVVFGTRAELVVAFERRTPGETPDGHRCDKPWLFAQYDFVLPPEERDQ